MVGFRRTRRGIEARLRPAEVTVLERLVGELAELLDADAPAASGDPLEAMVGIRSDPEAPVDAPSDPVLARLLPDGYRDDDEAALKFRELTENELREGKLANAHAILATLHESRGHVHLDEEA